MKKWFPLLFIAGGIFFIVYAGWQMWESHSKEKTALSDARQLLTEEKPESKTQSKTIAGNSSKNTPEMGEAIGILVLPALHEELPIIEGTDEDDLEKGVGHLKRSVLPGQHDQIVMSGHRDTVFKRLGELKIGDELIVKMPSGTFSYVINDTDIVDKDDTTVIRSTAPREVLTVTTCYPFGYIGNAPERYIIYAEPKPAVAALGEADKQLAQQKQPQAKNGQKQAAPATPAAVIQTTGKVQQPSAKQPDKSQQQAQLPKTSTPAQSSTTTAKATVMLTIEGGADKGRIVNHLAIQVSKDDTVIDVLLRTAKQKQLQVSVKGRGSASYVEGIDNLYEFDRGPMSGWIFIVNGKKSDKGAGAYSVKSGDTIEWQYTENMGKDVP